MLIQEASIPVFVTATKWIVIIFYFLVFLKLLYVLRILKYKDSKRNEESGTVGDRSINDPNDPQYHKRELLSKIKKAKKKISEAKNKVKGAKKSSAKKDLKTAISEAKYKIKKVESLLHKAKSSQITELERIIQEVRVKSGAFDNSLVAIEAEKKKITEKIIEIEKMLAKARTLHTIAKVKGLKSEKRLKDSITKLEGIMKKVNKKIKS